MRAYLHWPKRPRGRRVRPYDKAVAIERFLRSRYAYTLKLSGKPGDDPLAHFLFETHAGHCEYFASAMTIMLRTLGIPSREVNGFLPGEYNDLAGDYIVRASDAHSWVEVYFPGTGWVTFDPTPAAIENFGSFVAARSVRRLDGTDLERVGDQLRFCAPGANGANHAAQHAELDGSRRAPGSQRKRRTVSSGCDRGWTDVGTITFAVPMAIALLLVLLRYDVLRAGIRRLRLYLQLRAPEGARANPQLASRLYCGIAAIAGTARLCAAGFADATGVCGSGGRTESGAGGAGVHADLRSSAVWRGGLAIRRKLRGLLEQIRAARR